MAFVIAIVSKKMAGKANNKIKENHQPLKKAKKRPEKDIANDN